MENGYGVSPAEVEYWKNHRYRMKDLYPSEKYFLEPALKKVDRVLDVGCAAGGGGIFCKEVNPHLSYTGVDVSENLIAAARKRFREDSSLSFHAYDGKKLPVEAASFPLVFSLGVLHHVPHWKEMIREMYQMSSRYVIFDLRLSFGPTLDDPSRSYQKIALSGTWDGKTVIPYLVINMAEALGFLQELAVTSPGQRGVVRGFGYFGRPTSLAVTPIERPLMISFLLEKEAVSPGLFLEIPSP